MRNSYDFGIILQTKHWNQQICFGPKTIELFIRLLF